MTIESKVASATIHMRTSDANAIFFEDDFSTDDVFVRIIQTSEKNKELRVCFKTNGVYHAIYVPYSIDDHRIITHDAKYYIVDGASLDNPDKCIRSLISLDKNNYGSFSVVNNFSDEVLNFPAVRIITDILSLQKDELITVLSLVWVTNVLNARTNQYGFLSASSINIYFDEPIGL